MPLDRVRTSEQFIGQVLDGTYKLTRAIGQGGMGSIYEAVHVRLPKKRFAVKLLRSEAARVPDLFARFRREAEVTTEIGHPNIVDVMDFHEMEDGRPYMIMEYLEGENLANRLAEEGRMPPEDVLLLAQQVGSALQAAHDHGIVHRDMKPENIYLLDSDDGLKAKVLDFGISKIQHSKSIVTEDHSLLGTVYFMSPEQAEGAVKNIGPATDIFALGAICYQALTGILPFDAPTIPGVIYQVCHSEPKPVSEIVPGIPAIVDVVLDRALAKDRQERYQKIDHFVAALGLALAGEDPTTAETTGSQKPLSDSQARKSGVDVYAPTQNPENINAYARTHSDDFSSFSQPVGAETTGDLRAVDRSGRIKMVVAGGLVLAAAVAGLFYLGQRGGPTQTAAVVPPGGQPASPAPKTSTAETPPAPAAPGEVAPDRETRPGPLRKIEVRLVLSPKNAAVLLNGRPRKDNPLVLEADGKKHRLKVTARGYTPFAMELMADRQQSHEVTLHRTGRRTNKHRNPVAGKQPVKPRPNPETAPAQPAKPPAPPPAKPKTKLGESPSSW